LHFPCVVTTVGDRNQLLSEDSQMPMFEYKCPSCGSNFEKLLPHAKADDVECVACSAKAER